MTDPRLLAALCVPIVLVCLTLGLEWLAGALDVDIITLGLMLAPGSALGLFLMLRKGQPQPVQEDQP